MHKTKWYSKVFYLAIALALVVALSGAVVGADPAKESEWDDVSTPSLDDKVILPGSDIFDFAIGPDGDVIYAIGELPADATHPSGIALWKSTDGGATWSDKTSKLLKANVKKNLPAGFDDLVQVAVAPNDEDFVVVAGMDATNKPMVVGSIDGATKFYYTGLIVDTAAEILCMDVSRGVDDIYNIAVGTSTGEIWRYAAGEYWGGRWEKAMPEAITPLPRIYVDAVGGSDTTGDGLTPATAFQTIGAAISVASSGDTIIVAAGTYTEDLVFDGDEADTITIKGATVTTDDVVLDGKVSFGGSTTGLTFDTIKFQAVASDELFDTNGLRYPEDTWQVSALTVKDCHIVSDTATAVFRDMDNAVGDNFHFINNTVENFVDTWWAVLYFDVFGDPLTTGWKINGNDFINCGGTAIAVMDQNGIEVKNNVIDYSGVPMNAETWGGIQVGGGRDIDNPNPVLIEGNTVTGPGKTIHTGGGGNEFAGISICYWENLGDANATIKGNTITDCWRGISVANVSGVTIVGNDVSGCTAGISPEGVCNDIVTSRNNIHGNNVGILLPDDRTLMYDTAYSNPDGDNVFHDNNITGNADYGIENMMEEMTVDAEDNWWGDETGPFNTTTNPDAWGDTVSDHVDYRPWLLEPVEFAPIVTPPYEPVPTEAPAGDYAGWMPSKAVTSVVFSPSWSRDKTVLVITTVDTKPGPDGIADATYLQTGKWGTTKGWGSEVDRAKAVEFKVKGESITPTDIFSGVTGMALPSDYNGRDSSLRRVYAYVDVKGSDGVTPGGYLFRIDSTTLSTPCGPSGHPWFSSIAYHGDYETGDTMLGQMMTKDEPPFTECCTGVQVWRTDEIDLCCPDWSKATKKPSGQGNALVAFTPDGDKAYAVTKGFESAFSVSLDDGKCWNQLSLIDTNIDYLSDVAVSPDCDITYLVSINEESGCGCDSVWMKDANATEYTDVWQRVYQVELGGGGLLRLSPEHDDVVYLGALSTSNIYWAESKGICKWRTKDSPTIAIQDFALADDNTLYVINDEDDLVKWSEDKGDWTSTVDHKAVAGHTITVLDDYVLVGGSAGSVGYSDDAGDSFSRLGDKGTLTDNVHVAFDSYFEDNNTVYAAVGGGTDNGIYRWVVDDSTSWKDLKATAQDYFGIVLDRDNPMTDEDTGGVLYAVYEDGMARWLGAAQTPSATKWDYLENGAASVDAFKVEPSALRICDSGSSLLWAINASDSALDDEGKNNLFVYEDCLAKAAVELSKVEDEAIIASDPCKCHPAKFVLEWDDLCNSSAYELEIALDEDFDFVELTTKPGNDYLLEDEYLLVKSDEVKKLDCNTTYYWRVRVIEADSGAETIRSWWSDGWSFTVQAGPAAAIQLTAPEVGATGVVVKGVSFTWTSVAAATSYDFALMDSAGIVVSSKTGLTGTAYTCLEELNYDATYTWKVTAMKGGSVLSESSLSTFRTVPTAVFTCPQCGLSFPSEAALKAHIAEAHAPVVPTTPPWVWVVIALGAILVITIIVLIFRTRRV